MAGAGLAAAIGSRARVLLLEAEDMPGRHATGRSAAFWSETYGGPAVQPLTTASGPALRDGGYLTPLGSLHVGRAEDEARVERLLTDFDGSGVALSRVDPAARIPGLRPEWVHGVWEPSCAYIDVAALHADCLAAAKAAGTEIRTDAALLAAERRDGVWHLETPRDRFRPKCWSMQPVPGPMTWRSLRASRRSASPPIAGPWCNCAPIRLCRKASPMSST